MRQERSKITPPPTVEAPRSSTGQLVGQGVSQGLNQAGQSAIGTGKGLLSTVNNIAKLGQKALQKITGIKSNSASLPEKLTTPTEAQKPAFVGEQIGEFFVP